MNNRKMIYALLYSFVGIAMLSMAIEAADTGAAAIKIAATYKEGAACKAGVDALNTVAQLKEQITIETKKKKDSPHANVKAVNEAFTVWTKAQAAAILATEEFEATNNPVSDSDDIDANDI